MLITDWSIVICNDNSSGRKRQLISRILGAVPWSWRSRIKQIPGISWLQRAVVAASLNGREFIHEVDAGPARGVRFLVRMPEDKGIWTGTYEAGFAAAVAHAIRPGIIAYDIGGWHGFFAGIMAAQGARQVHVFEPLPANGERIEQLARLNPQFDIHLHRCAIGDHDGQIQLLVMPQSSMAKVVDSSFQPDVSPTQCLDVKLASVDSLVASGAIAPPDIIKIDVEGAEGFVLRGALNVLKQHGPIVFVEIHSPALFAECSNLLSGLGYRISMIGTNSWPTNDVAPVHIRGTWSRM